MVKTFSSHKINFNFTTKQRA